MLSESQINTLRKDLASYRDELRLLEKQRDFVGSRVRESVLVDIEKIRRKIQRIEAILREAGIQEEGYLSGSIHFGSVHQLSAHPPITSPMAIISMPPPHLNTRFDNVAPDQPLPVGIRIPLIIWVSGQIETTRSQTSRPFGFNFSGPDPVSFNVRVRADPESWKVEDVKTQLIVAEPGTTHQEAVFLVTALHPGREKLYITIEQPDGAIVQDIWLTVDAANPTQKPNYRERLSALLPGQLGRWFALHPSRVASPPPQARSVGTPSPTQHPPSGSPYRSESARPLLPTNPSFVAHTQNQPKPTAAPLAAAPAAAYPIDPSPARREVTLPLDTKSLRRRTVRLTFQQSGRDSSAFNVFAVADLPTGRLYRDLHLPISSAEIQNATLRLRQELQRIVFYEHKTAADTYFPFADYTTLTVDEPLARQVLVSLADVGQQVWALLFDGPRTPDTLRQFAAAIRDLPHGSTIQIVLDNQHFILPWALLYDKPGPITAETLDWSGFWGYRYMLDILTPGNYPEPPIDDTPLDLRLFFNDSADLNIYTTAQSSFVRTNLKPARTTPSWGTASFTELLRAPDHTTLLYCYCHGTHTSGAITATALASESALTFTAGERQRLADLRRISSAQLAGRPLVFLNACEGAAQDAFYYDGFMPFFIEERGARAFIGTEVKTPIFFAHTLALNFFESFARGSELSHILWQLRRTYLNEHNNILAFNYTLYGLGETHLVTPLSPDA